MARERFDDEYDDRDDDRPRRRRGGDPAVGRQMVKGPGTWLIVAGAVMLLFWVANLGVLVSGYDMAVPMMEFFGQMIPANDPGRANFDKQLEEMKTRDRTGEYVQGAFFALVGLVVDVLIIVGGSRMKQARSKGLAMTGSILAMIPVNSCCCIGLPIGIWAIVTLGKPDVKAAFEASSAPRTFDDDLDDRG